MAYQDILKLNIKTISIHIKILQGIRTSSKAHLLEHVERFYWQHPTSVQFDQTKLTAHIRYCLTNQENRQSSNESKILNRLYPAHQPRPINQNKKMHL